MTQLIRGPDGGHHFFQNYVELLFAITAVRLKSVKTQIWIAVSIYLLVAILKKRLALPGSLHTILQILEVNIFDKRSIIQIVKDANKQEPERACATN